MLSWGQKATKNWIEELERGIERSVGYRLAKGNHRGGGQACQARQRSGVKELAGTVCSKNVQILTAICRLTTVKAG